MAALGTSSRRLFGLLLVAVLVGGPFAARPAVATTIGFTVETTVTTDPGVTVKVALTNVGDETAYAVVPTVVVGKTQQQGNAGRRIDPGATERWTIAVSPVTPKPGGHVVLVRIAYKDANDYPFEVVTATPFSTAGQPRPAVRGRIRVPSLDTDAVTRGFLDLQIPPTRGGNITINLVLPSGLETDPIPRTIHLGANRRLRLPVSLRNRSLLEGTRIDLFALVTILDETPPQTDVIHGVARIVKSADQRPRSWVGTVIIALILGLAVLEVGTWRRPRVAPDVPESALVRWAEIALIGSATAFLLVHYPWSDLLAPTTTSGGDMASLFYPTRLMAKEILPRGELTGWTMGNYAGFPVFHFYSTLPFALIALLGYVAPLQQTFKLVTLIGPTFLPLAAAGLFRALGYRRSSSAIAAVSVIPFLLQQGNSMWGGNIPSVLAGEFCHAIGLTLTLVFLGVVHRCVQGRSSWPLAAVILTAIGLTHTFAFFAAVWCSLFFLWPQKGLNRSAPPLLATYAVTFLLLCFWGLPLPARLVFTSEWSMIWRIKDWREVLPAPLWPAAALAAVGIMASLVRIKDFRWNRQGLLVFTLAGGVFLYFLVPALGFPDIRFVPVVQLFLCLLAADTLVWLATPLRHHVLFATLVVVTGLAWGQAHLGYIPAWLHWNYAGYERKASWNEFKRINDHLRGDMNEPRVVFEHSQTHNRFGSSRAFENLPLFAGRATLEGVFHQASLNSPFIFYLQSEASERGSGPFPQYTYTRLNPAAALPHLRMYNVGQIIVVSDKAKAAYDAHPDYEQTFRTGAYAVYRVRGGNTGYVVPAVNEPVLYDGPDWKLAFYRWYKHEDLLDVPLVPADLISASEARHLLLRTDSITRIPRETLADPCHVTSRLEQYRITFETSCPDRPHIVKVSYFPRWHAPDGSRILPVSPGFMLVYPRGRSVTLVYRRNLIDWIGVIFTIFGAMVLVFCWIRPQARQRLMTTVAAPFMPILSFFEQFRRTTTVVLLIVLVAGAVATRVGLRTEQNEYAAAQTAYRARDFDLAIRLFEQWTAKDKDTFKQATALYQLGISYGEVENYAAAITVHERLRFDFPNVNYGAGTLFHLARNYHRLGIDKQARDYASALLHDYADSGWRKRLERELPELVPQPSGPTG